MGQIQSRQEKQGTVLELLRNDQTKARLGAALAKVGVTPERMVAWTMTALRRQPKLMTCDPMSLLGAVIQSAQLGLDPSGVTGEAYLVPYGREVTLIPGYRGLIALARRSGMVSEIMGHAVYEGDTFEFEYGLDSRLRHVPSTGARDPKALPTHVYAYAKFAGVENGRAFVVLTRNEVDLIRKRSRASGNGPWVTDYEAMAVKTAVRRLAKWLPLKADDYRAFEVAEREERGLVDTYTVDGDPVDAVPVGADVSDVAPEPAPAATQTQEEWDAEKSRQMDLLAGQE